MKPNIRVPFFETSVKNYIYGDPVYELALAADGTFLGVRVRGFGNLGASITGVAPLPLGEGRWRARVRFPALAVHTGEYVLSVYLFDSQGLVVYEQWMRCVHFRHVYALSMPGLVRLPHVWD